MSFEPGTTQNSKLITYNSYRPGAGGKTGVLVGANRLRSSALNCDRFTSGNMTLSGTRVVPDGVKDSDKVMASNAPVGSS